MKQKGILYGIGIGPGDPELLTLKTVRLLKNADVIAVPGKEKEKCLAYNIALSAVPEIKEKQILEFSMPMTKDLSVLNENYKCVAKLLMEQLSLGKSVAMLTLGDPTIYSTYIYVHRIILQNGYMAQIVNGIPSFCAASAALNDSLVDRGEALHIYPGSYELDEMYQVHGTKIIMKSAKEYKDVVKALKKTTDTVAMVENCGLPNERIVSGIDQLPEETSYYSILISKETS